MVSADVISQRTREVNPVIVIRARENRGFAAGNNMALSYCLRRGDGPYFWLLDNDTVVEENALEELVTHFRTGVAERAPLGMLGSKELYYDAPDRIQAMGGRYDRWFARCAILEKWSAIRTGTILGRTFPRTMLWVRRSS